MAIPATGAVTGTPASINERDPPQTLAIEEDPLDSKISETIRTVYGNLSSAGSTRANARSASAPCPTSLRPGERKNFTSPGEKGEKLKCNIKFLKSSPLNKSIRC